MSLVIPPGFGSAAFTLTGAVGTQPYITTMAVDMTDVGGDFVQAANACFVAYRESILKRTSNQLTLDRVTLAIGQDGPGGSVDSNLPPSPGMLSGVYPPTALSGIARKVTNQFGRAGRGRMFLPGCVSEAEVDQDGTLIVASRTALNTVLADFLTNLRIGTPGAGGGPYPGMDAVLLHSTAEPPTPLTGLVISDTVGWIRGRIR